MISDKHIQYAKFAANIISGLGVTKVVHDIVALNTISDSKLDSVKIWVGAGVLSSIVVDHSSDHILAKVDKVAAWLNEAKSEMDSE